MPKQPQAIIGWDIGGAHVKAALVADGHLQAVRQWPCALWQGLHHLDAVLDDALGAWAPAATEGRMRHAVTMTGEMVDLFESRSQGVTRLADHLGARLGAGMRIFGGDGRWFAGHEAGDHWQSLASANWAASARLAARRLGSAADRADRDTAADADGRAGNGPHAMAILVDIGSTTTDFIPLRAAELRGRSDAQRLQSGELLYHGVIRTPLCVLSPRIAFRGEWFNVMNEWFATTADVYRLTGELDADHDQHPSADGGPKDAAGSCRRIARMIGHDVADARRDDWIAFAHRWRDLQLDLLESGLRRVSPDPLMLVGAGCGGFLVRDLAQRLQRRHLGFADLVGAAPALRGWADVCAPAVAVAMLCQDNEDPWR
jgi:(4-(4-[2-(gamma-L-glutamylamino)ethyl]phenoxymethyl)furan-2-yl)methanamine synthase